MLLRRSFLGLLAAVFVAGCAEAPLLEEGASQSFAVRDVEVDTSAFKSVNGRVNELSRDEVARDISASVKNTLRRTAQGSRPVNVKVNVNKVYLVSPGQSFLIGGTSNIQGSVEVRDARTGGIVLPSTKVTGTAKGGYAPGGIIGVLTTRSVDNDYRATVAGFASDVELRLFGTRAGKPVRTASPQPGATPVASDASDSAPEETMEEYNRRVKCRNSIKICT